MASMLESVPDPAISEARKRLAQLIDRHAPSVGENRTLIPGLLLFRRTSTTACYRGAYEPSLNVFAQGRKRVTLGGNSYVCGSSLFLLSAIDVPVQSQIIEASEAAPLLSMLLRLDLGMVREILASEELPAAHPPAQGIGLALGEVSVGLLEACTRLVGLLDTPADAPFLSRLIERELVYRVLRSRQGERLRAIATTGDLSNRTARAISWLRNNFHKPLHMNELAEYARMGVSTLHRHFRDLTSMTPLQYQKQLRLQAARERMLLEGLDATTAAYQVGYESVSQFNREYSRMFGQPPKRDVRSLQAAGNSIHAA
jgi:AraC-like DNA-binding protein